MTPPIAFIDLAAQRRRIAREIDAAIAKVLDHGIFISGPEVAAFEAKLAAFCGARFAVACGNGTDALQLALMANGVGRGDAVIVPDFTFTATAEAVALVGGTPVFVDVQAADFNIDVGQLEAGLRAAKDGGLTPRALIAVDLFGLAADYEALNAFCDANGLLLIADAAQSFGAASRGRKVGTLAPITTTSFFPAKPLGCYGDGGAILTDDADLVAILKSLRVHGQGTDKYDNVRVGVNSRLDTIQAAILMCKLDVFADEIEARQAVAAGYTQALANHVVTPTVPDDAVSVWAQYTVRIPGGRRNEVAAKLKMAGVPTAIYYPKPLHHQTAYRHFPAVGSLAISERLSEEVLSLPMHPYLEGATQERIVTAVIDAA
ncbi:DegT/DnrJ/EryC1/StrS aminotransferase family protein [Enhydrobacter sp.]|uniref:DegT/DnrJ/EryC1/StrS family aminotransferase n=1 Tax=Enhydrobacter sp. TaxID=1894999 RepID=UPI00262D52B0|nr:DegT/DnrJ/EryC1/StrS aminotransferase family protein [Enhydrobacter sp.]WIM13726.1 MAG: DegT/DnrJ/EryC1/StrS aminotransferase [Enhydrobacter sp.]